MGDEELIARLRIEDHRELCQSAADRIEALGKERDALRVLRANMHRRAQRAEGKAHRSAHLLETILRSIKEVIPMLPTLPSPYPLSLHSLYHRVRAARDHARASSGRAWMEGWHIWRKYYDKEKARAERLEAALRDLIVAFAKKVDVNVTRWKMPYDHPLSAYDRAVATLDPVTPAPMPDADVTPEATAQLRSVDVSDPRWKVVAQPAPDAAIREAARVLSENFDSLPENTKRLFAGGYPAAALATLATEKPHGRA